MTIHEQAIAKLRLLPEPLVQEIDDFIDFLMAKRENAHWQRWNQVLSESAESDFSDYLVN